MQIGEAQSLVRVLYHQRGYTDDVTTLTLGLVEEVGEIAKAVNVDNPKYIQTKPYNGHSLEHEVKDALIYLFGIANSSKIDIDDLLTEYLSRSKT